MKHDSHLATGLYSHHRQRASYKKIFLPGFNYLLLFSLLFFLVSLYLTYTIRYHWLMTHMHKA